MNLKGTKEVLEAVKILAVSGKKIAKDGISLADLPEAVELIKHIDELILAAKDAHLVGSELKDLDQAELIELGSLLWSTVKEIKEA